jgi:hypothetical protein
MPPQFSQPSPSPYVKLYICDIADSDKIK